MSYIDDGEWDDLSICPICEDRYTQDVICYDCARQQAIDEEEQLATLWEREWLNIPPSDDPLWADTSAPGLDGQR